LSFWLPRASPNSLLANRPNPDLLLAGKRAWPADDLGVAPRRIDCGTLVPDHGQWQKLVAFALSKPVRTLQSELH